MYSHCFVIETYRKVLAGDLRRFPKNFWGKDVRDKHLGACVKFLIEEILEWDFDTAKRNLSTKILRKYRLNGGLRRLTDGSVLNILKLAYPSRHIYPWELHVTSMRTWKDESQSIAAVKWMIEEQLKWGKEDVECNLTRATFKEHHLLGCLSCAFNNRIIDALDAAYPGEFLKKNLYGYRLNGKSAM